MIKHRAEEDLQPEIDRLIGLQDELLAQPETREILQQVLDAECVHYILAAAQTARILRKLPDVWEARRILAESMAWIADTRNRAEKELAIKERPKQTHQAFAR